MFLMLALFAKIMAYKKIAGTAASLFCLGSREPTRFRERRWAEEVVTMVINQTIVNHDPAL